ncbi:MAG: glycosyltransferase family A protein [Thermomicrobiales bacterium]
MTQPPVVTICLPTIGRAAMLGEALESTRAQTWPNLEILILDNAAEEGDGQRLITAFAASHPRARILRSETRLPMFANFNRGIYAARGEYITFLFDDDLLRPTLVSRAVELLERYPQAGFAGSNYTLIDAAGQGIQQPNLIAQTGIVPGRRHIAAQMGCASMIMATPGVVYRRNLLAAFPFDAALSVYGGDLVMRLRMAEVADVALIAEPLVSVRVHPQTETARITLTEGLTRRAQMLLAYIDEYAARWPADRAFVLHLRARLALAHSATLGWDWLTLPDAAEAEQRRLGLRVVPGGPALAATLAASERLGLTPERRRTRLAPLLRRLGQGAPTPYR